MIRKSAIILICFLALIFISLGEVFPEIPRNGHYIAEANQDNCNLIDPHFYGSNGGIQNLDRKPLVSSGDYVSLNSITSPLQTGINLANANYAKSVYNHNVDALGSGTKPGGPSKGENHNYKFGYNGNSYTINFFNINYGNLFEKRPQVRRFVGGERNCRPQGIKDALRRLAEKRGVQEMEQKENLQLLKQIALE